MYKKTTINKNEILNIIKDIKSQYISDGLFLLGIFGSFARDEANEYSDIDIVYDIDYTIFFKKYHDGFSELLRIEELKHHLESLLHKNVDLISLKTSNIKLKRNIEKELIYV